MHINNENSKIRDISDNQNVNSTNYNEKYTFEYDSSEDNYVAMIEQNTSTTIAPQNMNKIISNIDCNLVFKFGSG